jgi:hypothetical protein
MQDRAATYDKPTGERSIAATVAAFKCVSGVEMTEEQGWLFMGLLKMVRSQQGEFKADNYEDEAAYAALRGECASAGRTAEDSLAVDGDGDAFGTYRYEGRMPPWATHELTNRFRKSSVVYAKYQDGQYLSGRGRIYNMHKWAVVNQQLTAETVAGSGVTNADGWIMSNGGGCPIGQMDGISYDIQFGDGVIYTDQLDLGRYSWSLDEAGVRDDMVIAYRIHKAAK